MINNDILVCAVASFTLGFVIAVLIFNRIYGGKNE